MGLQKPSISWWRTEDYLVAFLVARRADVRTRYNSGPYSKKPADTITELPQFLFFQSRH